MITIHQGYSTVTIHPLKMRGFIQDQRLARRRATQLKPEKIRIDELFCQPEKLYTESLLEVQSKSIAEEINTTLKDKCMACYDPALQVHSCQLDNPQEKVDRNFDNPFQLVDLWLANDTTFEKTKDKIVYRRKFVATIKKSFVIYNMSNNSLIEIENRRRRLVLYFVDFSFFYYFMCLFIFYFYLRGVP